MPNTGSGIGTAVPITVGAGDGPALTLPYETPANNCAVSLADYARYIGYDEPAFFGVTYDGQELNDCVTLWTERQRTAIARALDEAQIMMEGIMHIPLCPKWIEETLPYDCNPFVTTWGKLQASGKFASGVILDNAPVSYMTEPASVGPIATTVTNPDEIVFFLPDTQRRIQPLNMDLIGGFVTATFPRARLVLPSNDSNRGWVGNRFTDLFNFTTSVDIARHYTDNTVTAQYMRRSDNCAVAGVTACMMIENAEVGIVRAQRTDTNTNLCCTPMGMYAINLYYQAGYLSLTPVLSNAIIRLAHTLLPEHMCNQCDKVHRLWEKDTKVPTVLTRERINCPFGLSDGAWVAYKRAQLGRLVRGMVI